MAHLWPGNQNHCRCIPSHLENINHSLKSKMLLKWKQPAMCKSRSLANTNSRKVHHKWSDSQPNLSTTCLEAQAAHDSITKSSVFPAPWALLFKQQCNKSDQENNLFSKNKTKTKHPIKFCKKKKKITLPLLMLGYFSTWISFLTQYPDSECSCQ